MDRENYLLQIVKITFANLGLIITTVFMFIAVAALVIMFGSATYRLQGSLIVKSKKVNTPPEASEDKSRPIVTLPSPEDVILETRIVTDPQLIKQSVTELVNENLIVPQDCKARFWFDKCLLSDDSCYMRRVDMLIADVHDNITATVFPGSNIIDVKLKIGNPDDGKLILDRILDNYMGFRQSLFSETSTSEFYKSQISQYLSEMKAKDSNIINIMKVYNVSDARQEQDNAIQLITKMLQEVQTLEDDDYKLKRKIEYLEKIARQYYMYTGGDSISLPPPVESGIERGANNEINNLLMEYYANLRRYNDGSANTILIAKKISSELKNVINAEKERGLTIQRLLAEKRRKLQELRGRALELKKIDIQTRYLNDDVDIARTKYKTFLEKREESRLEKETELSQWVSVQVLSHPVLPDKPIFPDPVKVLLFSIVAGVFFAFVLSFLKEFFDRTFKYPQQVESILGIPVVGSIVKK